MNARLGMVLVGMLTLVLWLPVRGLAQDLTVGNYTQEASQRVSRFEFVYTLRAEVTNTGPDVRNVSAVLTGQPDNIVVIEGALSFGDVASGATVTSIDTFVLQVDRRFPFDPNTLEWNISAEPAQDLVAAFRAVPETGDAPLRVTFFPEPVTDSAIERYWWDLDGNGSFERTDVIGNAQVYTYSQPNTYGPRLRVRDSRGREDIQSMALVVGNAPPVITGASANPSNGQVPLTVAFSGSASDNEGIARYEWDFEGDGTFDFSSPSSASTSYAYTAVGTYEPVFRVTDTLGASTTHTVPATEVRAAPVGSPSVTASGSPTSGTVPLAVSFTGSATHPGGQPITLWEWDFEGDGIFDISSPSSPATSHTYTAAGTFFPRLRVTAADGASAEDVLQVSVAPTLSLSLTNDTIDTALGQAVDVRTQLGGETRVSLVIEDRAGQVVRTLVPWTQRAGGSYSDRWGGESDAGGTVAEGPYYAILLYEVDGQVKRLDLTTSTGGTRYNPPRSRLPSRFSPLAGQPLVINFTLSQASEVTAFMGRFRSNVRLVTFLQREPLGRGTHQIIWNGANNDGQLIHPPPGDRFLFGIFGYRFPNNGIYVRSGAHLSNLSVAPSIYDPTGFEDDQGTRNRSAVSFALSKPGSVELVVSNATTGAPVARRFYDGLDAGDNTVDWDGRDDSGLYVAPGRYRLGVSAIDANGYRSLRIYALQRVYY